MLDTLAAGAMSAGASVSAAARSEAAEEAGVPDELLAAGLKPVGAVSYRGPDEDPVLPKVCWPDPDPALRSPDPVPTALHLDRSLALACTVPGRRLLLLRPRAPLGLRARRGGRRGASASTHPHPHPQLTLTLTPAP